MVITDLQKTILSNRLKASNIEVTEENMKKYIANEYDIPSTLYSLKDLDKAGILLNKHIENNSNIVVCTDYDADGITSATTIYRYLKHRKLTNVTVIINKRKYGNGLNNTIMEKIYNIHKDNKIDLFITADHGSSNAAEITKLKELGIETIITDHHQIPDGKYPHDATVFINPNREDNNAYKEISGCYVAYLTMMSSIKYSKEENIKISDYDTILLPYVGISTISDVMPLNLLYNRYAVKEALHSINIYSEWIPIKTKLNMMHNLTAKDLTMGLVPYINSANRMDDEEIAYTILSKQGDEDITDELDILTRIYNRRKYLSKNILESTLEKLAEYLLEHSVVFPIDTEYAINGILSANVGEYVNKPAVCFIKNDGKYSGSCRGIVPGINVVEIFNSIHKEDNSILIKHGGHPLAGGCTIHLDKLEPFRHLFNKHAGLQLVNLDVTTDIVADKVLTEKEISIDTYLQTIPCGPYGKDWPFPIFSTVLYVHRVTKYPNIIKFIFALEDGKILNGYSFDSRVISRFTNEELLEEHTVCYSLEPAFYNKNEVTIRVLDIR